MKRMVPRLRDHQLFEGLSTDELETLALEITERKVDSGNAVGREGKPPDAFYVIRRGRALVAPTALTWALISPVPAYASVPPFDLTAVINPDTGRPGAMLALGLGLAYTVVVPLVGALSHILFGLWVLWVLGVEGILA